MSQSLSYCKESKYITCIIEYFGDQKDDCATVKSYYLNSGHAVVQDIFEFKARGLIGSKLKIIFFKDPNSQYITIQQLS